MQWNNQKNAGFSQSEPWIALNANYDKINVEKDLAESEDSIYRFYQKLIELEKQMM